jgi:myo-inositol-1(or 4)-monophosphatase
LPEADLALLKNAAREAGDIALSYWRRDPKVWEKGVDGPVSEADFAVDNYLRETLQAARPEYGWLSEETEDDEARLSRECVFVCDPIDGTRAFISGKETWAHAIAVVRHGAPVAGVVYLPARDRLYAAAEGGGATLNGARIGVSGREAVAGASVLSNRAAFEARHWRGPVPEVERHFRPSLAYRMALVAEGRFDAMLTLRRSWEWDIAAGALIAAEAGARVTDRTGGPLAFNSPGRHTDGVVAANPALAGSILGALA